MGYQTIFDVAQKTLPWNNLLYVLPIALIGFEIFVLRRHVGNSFTRNETMLACALLLAMLSIVLIGLWSFSDDDRTSKSRFSNEQFYVTEGEVEDFKPMPFEGHALESFRVQGHQFSYSDYIWTPCFNNSSSHGGPIRSGLSVRISYYELSGTPLSERNCILKLEVRSKN